MNPRRTGPLLALLALLALLWVLATGCSTTPPSAAPPPAPAAAETAPDSADEAGVIDSTLQSTREAVRSTAEWLARGVDNWFGDQPFEEGGKVSDGVLRLGWLQRADVGSDVALRFNARFRLPNLQKRAFFFIGRDDPRDAVTAKPEALSRGQRLLPEDTANQELLAGLAVPLRERIDFRIGVRGGLKPYVQLRYAHPWAPTEIDLVDFRQTFFWTIDDHLGSTTALSLEHAFSASVAARWLTAATITRVVRKFEWTSSLGLYQSLGPQRVQSVQLLISGVQDSGVGIGEYGLQVKREQPLHKDWLIGELSLGHFWPRRDALSERERVWALGAGLRLLF